MTDIPWRDEAKRKMSLHLRLLYDSRLANDLLFPVNQDSIDSCWLSTVDTDRLFVEQRTRIRALISQVRASCGPLWDVVGEPDLYAIMEIYTMSPGFWTASGRSLAEGFCLCAQTSFLQLGREDLAGLAQLLGIASGLPANLDRKSPWEQNIPVPDLGIPGVVASEGFMSNFSLIDENGQPRLGKRLNSAVLSFVLCFDDRSMILGHLDNPNV